MSKIYVIGDTIRFTASITNLDGQAYDPDEVKVSVISPNGKALLKEATAMKTLDPGNYYYDWKIEGVADPSNLIVVWDWSGSNKKRMKFKVVPETDY